MAQATAQPTYVYGIVSAEDPPPKAPGIGGEPLHEVTSEGLAAIVSPLADDGEIQLGREEMTAHQRVLEEAVESTTVLPMRFGVVMGGEEAVKEHLLDAYRDELKQQLQDLNGKVELRVRATYEEDTLMREVIQENPDIARRREQLRGQNEDATYYKRIELGEAVAAAVQAKREYDAEQLMGALASLAVATEVGEPTHERMVLSASFLVERNKMAEFDEVVDALGEAQEGRMRLKYVGPLPPHSFVHLRTGTEA